MDPQNPPQPSQPPAAPGQNQPGANQPQQPMVGQHIQDPNAKFVPPNQRGPNRFSAPIPGQSLTDTPKNAAWEHPPQFTQADDAINYVFDQIVMPQHLRMFLGFLSKGQTIEQIARIILFTGFSEGKWTPDLAMLMVKPVVHILAGIAARAGQKHVKITNTDRSGFDKMVQLQKLNISSSNPTPTPSDTSPKQAIGLMAPK